MSAVSLIPSLPNDKCIKNFNTVWEGEEEEEEARRGRVRCDRFLFLGKREKFSTEKSMKQLKVERIINVTLGARARSAA